MSETNHNDPAESPVAHPESADAPKPLPRCGLIMPISGIDGCPETHWLEVKAILTDAIRAAGFDAAIVSAGDDVTIIHKRIIQNLYENPIVVCDVSGKNPNVMFELGIRLAFDKPTVIVKDDKTTYSFDTSPIEHLEYPRDLRFTRIVAFKAALTEKVQATEKASKDPSYTTFLKHFGTFEVAKVERKQVSQLEFVTEELQDIRRLVQSISRADSKRVAKTETIIISDSHIATIKAQFLEKIKNGDEASGPESFYAGCAEIVRRQFPGLTVLAAHSLTTSILRSIPEFSGRLPLE